MAVMANAQESNSKALANVAADLSDVAKEIKSCTIAITENTTQNQIQSRDHERLIKRIDKQDALLRTTHDEVVENRTVIKLMAGLNKKLLGMAGSIIASAALVILTIKGM